MADVVSFAERLAQRSAGSGEQSGERSAEPSAEPRPGDASPTAEHERLEPPEDASGSAAGGPADLAKAAMLRRLVRLTGSGHPVEPVDEALAVLVYDSAIDPDRLADIRGAPGADGAARQLTFRSPGLTIEVEVDGSGRELVCQVVPPQPASLEVCHRNGSLDLGRDEFGTFYLPEIPGDLIRLRCVPAGGTGSATGTGWVTL